MSAAEHLRPEHRLLLEAILSPSERSRRAIDRWTPGVEIATLDYQASPVIGLLAPRLDADHDAAILRSVRQVERATWLRGQALVRRVQPAIRALQDKALDVVLLKGPALAHHAGTTARTRPMDDIDVLVEPGDIRHAARVLLDAGFHSELAGLLVGPDLELMLDHTHGTHFSDGNGANLDLHWRALHGPGHLEQGRRFRRAAVDAEFAGCAVRVTSREDTLVHVVAHNEAHKGSLRWATDAALLLRTGPVDWDAVARRSAELELGRAVADALAYLVELEAADVHAGVLRDLRRQRTSAVTRRLGQRAQRPWPEGPLAEDVLRQLRATVPPGRRARETDERRARRSLDDALTRPPSPLLHPVALGELVPAILRPDGRCCPYLVAGWQNAEGPWTWTTNSRARLVVPLREPCDDPLLVELLVSAMLGPRLPRLEVDVHEAGERIATWSLHGVRPAAEARTLWLAPSAGRTMVDLMLRIRSPRTADGAGLNGELRRFGLALHHFRVNLASR